MKEKVLIISPHPDDETLGAGATILKFKKTGREVYWLNMTNMKKSYGYDSRRVLERNKEIKKVIKAYQFDGFFNLGLKPSGLDQYPLALLVDKISEVIRRVQPHTMILPYKNDIHSDHRVVFEAAFACTKTFRSPYVKKVLMMEVPSETHGSIGCDNFSANYFVDVSDYLKQKIQIMKIYKSEFKSHPFPRSEEMIKAIATMRGSEVGCQYAEGFVSLKQIT